MALMFNDDHIIYYHMDATHSFGLVQNYFTHPNYSVVNFGSAPLIYLLTQVTKWDLRPIFMFFSENEARTVRCPV